MGKTQGTRPALGTTVLEALYDAYHRQALELAYALLGNKGAAEEVVEDVFLSAWQIAHAYDPARGTARVWLLGQVRDRAIKLIRARPGLRPSVVAQAATRRAVSPAAVRSDTDDALREVNQRLLLACLRQQELADEAEAARRALSDQIRGGEGLPDVVDRGAHELLSQGLKLGAQRGKRSR
jgi:DNA-directed RNA polymerase specialized sigma24 family protein